MIHYAWFKLKINSLYNLYLGQKFKLYVAFEKKTTTWKITGIKMFMQFHIQTREKLINIVLAQP